MMGAFSEFARAMISERVIAGLRTAKKEGMNLGRRRIDGDKVGKIHELRAKAYGMIKIARARSDAEFQQFQRVLSA